MTLKYAILDFSGTGENHFILKNKEYNVELWLKREDLIHPEISGNKFRKLKYNLLEAKKQDYEKILTFGGAYSNHIAATAAAGKIFGFKTIGVVRGEELGVNLEKTLAANATLNYANACGMELHFISRERYRERQNNELLLELSKKFGTYYLLPEGGTNKMAVKGCEEILAAKDKDFNLVCCPVGTGGTIAGIINSSSLHQKILGFPALRGDFLKTEIENYTHQKNWELVTDYHFGGYARITAELVEFINFFKFEYKVQLDPIYTGKMMFGIFDMLKRGEFIENTRILAIHTGGLQGIIGMNKFLEKKKMPLIE